MKGSLFKENQQQLCNVSQMVEDVEDTLPSATTCSLCQDAQVMIVFGCTNPVATHLFCQECIDAYVLAQHNQGRGGGADPTTSTTAMTCPVWIDMGECMDDPHRHQRSVLVSHRATATTMGMEHDQNQTMTQIWLDKTHRWVDDLCAHGNPLWDEKDLEKLWSALPK
eukprot:scaffold3597_cov202-Amphora_coffeaeformis.AAC.3